MIGADMQGYATRRRLRVVKDAELDPDNTREAKGSMVGVAVGAALWIVALVIVWLAWEAA